MAELQRKVEIKDEDEEDWKGNVKCRERERRKRMFESPESIEKEEREKIWGNWQTWLNQNNVTL